MIGCMILEFQQFLSADAYVAVFKGENTIFLMNSVLTEALASLVQSEEHQVINISCQTLFRMFQAVATYLTVQHESRKSYSLHNYERIQLRLSS